MSWLDRLTGKGAEAVETAEDRPMPDRAPIPADAEPKSEPQAAQPILALVATAAAPAADEPAAPDEAAEAEWPSNDELMANALAAAQAGDYETALGIWEPLARDGHGRAQNNIGACFIDGLGVEQNLELAREWLELAAEAGDPVGQRNLARLYLKGLGGSADKARAIELYRLAAEAGDAAAQDMLSYLLFEGEPADTPEARRWAEAAAAQGVATAMTRLGLMAHEAHLAGEIGAPDETVAAGWWRKAAEAGDADGAALLGAAHHLGVGVARDRVAAFAWLLRAKAGGSALAERFFDAVRTTLSPEEQAAAERRAAESTDTPAA